MTANLLHNVQLKLHYGAFILSAHPFYCYCLNIFSLFTSNQRLAHFWRIAQVKEKNEENKGETERAEGTDDWCFPLGRTLSSELQLFNMTQHLLSPAQLRCCPLFVHPLHPSL